MIGKIIMLKPTTTKAIMAKLMTIKIIMARWTKNLKYYGKKTMNKLIMLLLTISK